MPFLGRPLIEYVLRRLVADADEVLVTTQDPAALDFLGVRCVTDRLPGRGALGGLYTALAEAQCAIVAVVACDMPFASRELLMAQRKLLVELGVDVVIPQSPDGLEPLHAVYRRETCLVAVEQALQREQRRMIAWFDAVRVAPVLPEELSRYADPHRTFLNLNTPEEFAQAEQLAQAEG